MAKCVVCNNKLTRREHLICGECKSYGWSAAETANGEIEITETVGAYVYPTIVGGEYITGGTRRRFGALCPVCAHKLGGGQVYCEHVVYAPDSDFETGKGPRRDVRTYRIRQRGRVVNTSRRATEAAVVAPGGG